MGCSSYGGYRPTLLFQAVFYPAPRLCCNAPPLHGRRFASPGFRAGVMPYDSTLSRVYARHGLYYQYGVGLGRVLGCAVVKVLHYSRRYSVPRFTARGGVQIFLGRSDYRRHARPAVSPGRWAGALLSTSRVYITAGRNVNPFFEIFLNIFSAPINRARRAG